MENGDHSKSPEYSEVNFQSPRMFHSLHIHTPCINTLDANGKNVNHPLTLMGKMSIKFQFILVLHLLFQIYVICKRITLKACLQYNSFANNMSTPTKALQDFLQWEGKQNVGTNEINQFGEILNLAEKHNCDIRTAYLHWKYQDQTQQPDETTDSEPQPQLNLEELTDSILNSSSSFIPNNQIDIENFHQQIENTYTDIAAITPIQSVTSNSPQKKPSITCKDLKLCREKFDEMKKQTSKACRKRKSPEPPPTPSMLTQQQPPPPSMLQQQPELKPPNLHSFLQQTQLQQPQNIPEKRGRPSKIGILAKQSAIEMNNYANELKHKRVFYRNNYKDYITRYANDVVCVDLQQFKNLIYITERRAVLLQEVKKINEEYAQLNLLEDTSLGIRMKEDPSLEGETSSVNIF